MYVTTLEKPEMSISSSIFSFSGLNAVSSGMWPVPFLGTRSFRSAETEVRDKKQIPQVSGDCE